MKKSIECSNKTEFRDNYRKYYDYARSKNWLSDICKHMSNKNFKCTKEKCMSESIKYNFRGDFKKGCRQANQIS